MYKNFTNFLCRSLSCTKPKNFLKLKLTVLLCAFAFIQVSAASFGQAITLNVKNLPFEQLLANLSQQSGYHFLYRKKIIERSKPVSVVLKEVSLEEALKKCFAEEPFTYVIKSNNVIIVDKPAIVETVPVANSPQKKVDVSGTVTDEKNQPMPGVSVGIKGTLRGAITDKDGKFVITGVNEDAVLVFTFVGYSKREVQLGGQTSINVSLSPRDGNLNEVVVVAYGTQAKKDLTGAISTAKSEELTAAPVASTTNTLAGRLPGLISKQEGGQPGYDAASLSIRGFGSALVIIDGVESNINNIDPNQIETISILKDASAAIYGARAGNGVVLITTKRGNSGKPVFTYTGSYTLQGITQMPKPVSAGQYAELKSEAWLQSGQPASNVPFTEEQIQKYYQGTDPNYPNTDWYSILVRNWAPQYENNISVRGGSEKIKYYGFLGYLNQQSMWRMNGGKYQRYNLQSNIDAQINSNLTMQFDLSSVVEARDNPNRPQGAGSNNVWQDFWNTLPIYPAILPDPTKVSYANGSGTGGAHVTTNSDISGYDNLNSQNLKGTLALVYKTPFIKGLSAKALINYLQDYNYERSFSKPVKFYTYDYAANTYTQAGSLNAAAALAITNSRSQVITGQASLSYDNTFHNNDHHVQALALYEAINYGTSYESAGRTNFLTAAIDQLFAGNSAYQTANGSATQAGRQSFVGRVNYSYLGRYLFESTIRADASSVFPPGKQWGYFPSVSLGWIVSGEKFMDKYTGTIDELKIRTSYGQSGLDNVGNYQYLTGYQFGGTYLIGANPQPGLISSGLANPDLTWERIKTYNIGVDFSLWKRKLYGTAEGFFRELTGIPATLVTTLPSTFGATLPPVNINSLNNRGFELQVGTAGHAQDFSWNIAANVSWSRAKWQHYEEPDYTDQDQRRISQQSGHWTDLIYGYKSDGLFTSQAEINALKFDQDGQHNSTLRPGDIKYVDVNGDGVLNYKDEVNIGMGTVPHWMEGLNASLKYKDFDMAMLWQGAMGFYTNVNLLAGSLTYPSQVYQLRWTQQNDNPNALIPRLGGAATNGLSSDYYYRNASYARLKSLAIGYTLPKKIMQKAGFSQLRLYLAGTNLLTFSGISKYGFDPEAPSGQAGRYYPQQRTLSLGLNASF